MRRARGAAVRAALLWAAAVAIGGSAVWLELTFHYSNTSARPVGAAISASIALVFGGALQMHVALQVPFVTIKRSVMLYPLTMREAILGRRPPARPVGDFSLVKWLAYKPKGIGGPGAELNYEARFHIAGRRRVTGASRLHPKPFFEFLTLMDAEGLLKNWPEASAALQDWDGTDSFRLGWAHRLKNPSIRFP